MSAAMVAAVAAVARVVAVFVAESINMAVSAASVFLRESPGLQERLYRHPGYLAKCMRQVSDTN